MAQVTESDYEEAVKGDAKVRQEFLDAIDIGDFRFKNFKGLVYIPELVRVEGHFLEGPLHLLMQAFTKFSPTGRGSILRSRVDIYSHAFREGGWDKFINDLKCHEKHHLRQHSSNPLEVHRRTIVSLDRPKFQVYNCCQQEIPAYLNQLYGSDKFELSGTDFTNVHSDLRVAERRVKEEAKKLGRDWRKDMSQILCPAPYDNLVRERYSL